MIQRKQRKDNSEHNPVTSFIYRSIAATCIAVIVTQPLDVIVTRVNTQFSAQEAHLPKCAEQCGKNIQNSRNTNQSNTNKHQTTFKNNKLDQASRLLQNKNQVVKTTSSLNCEQRNLRPSTVQFNNTIGKQVPKIDLKRSFSARAMPASQSGAAVSAAVAVNASNAINNVKSQTISTFQQVPAFNSATNSVKNINITSPITIKTAFKQIWLDERGSIKCQQGLKVSYSGFYARLCAHLPANVLTWGTYELIKHGLTRWSAPTSSHHSSNSVSKIHIVGSSSGK